MVINYLTTKTCLKKMSITIESYSEIKYGQLSITIPSVINGLNMTTLGHTSCTLLQIKSTFPINKLVVNVAPGYKKIAAFKSVGTHDAEGYHRLEYEIYLPTTISSLEPKAFQELIIQEIELRNTKIKQIPKQCFMNCNFRHAFIVPKGIKSIQDYAFASAKLCEGIVFEENSTLTEICQNAFSLCDMNVNYLKIPRSVKTIESNAFSYCFSIDEIRFAEDSELETIGKYAFSTAPIRNIELPASCKELGDNCFYSCEQLISADLSKTQIQELEAETFSQCFKLKDVSLPECLESIGSRCFEFCKLTSFNPPKSLTSIGPFAFFKNKIKELNFDFLKNIVSIGQYAFSGNSLEEININHKIPSSSAYKPTALFSDCGQLKKVTISKNKNIYKEMFLGCVQLSEINLSDEVQTIESGAFRETNLSSLKLGKNISRISSSAFMNCNNLTEIDLSETSVKELYANTFKCRNLSTIKLPYYLLKIHKNCFDKKAMTIAMIADIKAKCPFVEYCCD